jgi:hypothetical protein
MHIHIECMKEGSLYPIGKGIENEDHVLSFTQIKNGCDRATIKWHLRFGHCNMQTLSWWNWKKMVNGINDFIFKLPFYKKYLYGKQQRLQGKRPN